MDFDAFMKNLKIIIILLLNLLAAKTHFVLYPMLHPILHQLQLQLQISLV